MERISKFNLDLNV